MDRKTFLTAGGAAMGLAAVGSRPARAAETSERGLRSLGKNDVKIALQPQMFGGKDFLEQIGKVAYYGFPGVARLGTSRIDIDAARRKLDELGLTWVCISGAGRIAPGNMSSEDEHPAQEERFRKAVATAKRLNIKRILALTGNKRDDITQDQQTAVVVKGLKRLAPIAEQAGVTIVLEMLNVLVNHPGYFLVYTPHGVEIIQAVNSPNVKLLYDIYHQQISEGNLINNITKNIKIIGHFHIGDNPGRKQPGTGEINYKNVFKAVHETGYDGFLSMECGYTKPPLEVMKTLHDLTTFG